MKKQDAHILADALLELWQYAARIQHTVPKDKAFDLLFERIDQRWVEAAHHSK